MGVIVKVKLQININHELPLLRFNKGMGRLISALNRCPYGKI